MKLTKLQKAVYTQLGSDDMEEFLSTLEDVRNHGADVGFSGFIYYAETMAFARKHKKLIMEEVESMAHDLGEGVIEMVAGFNCLHGNYSVDEVARALYQGKGDGEVQVLNALAWYALEQVAHQLESVDA